MTKKGRKLWHAYVIRWRTGKIGTKGRKHVVEISNRSKAERKLTQITGSSGTFSVYFTKRRHR